jgi:hypothetical protein
VSELPRIVPAQDAEGPRAVADAAPGSLIARLRARAQETQRARTLDLPVPGWGGELVLRFQPLDIAALEHLLSHRGAEATTSGINETVDAMVRACVAVLATDEGELVTLEDEAGPIRLENRLVVLLGLDADHVLTAREVVLRLFGGNAFALADYVDKLVTWMNDPDAYPTPGES